MGDAVLTVQNWEDIDNGVPVELNGDLDSTTCLVTFQQHWHQASEIIRKSWKLPGGVSPDDVSCVINNLEQMASLILVDAQLHKDNPGPIMDLLLKDNILGTLLEWSLQCEEYAVPLKLEQLKIYELLFSHSHLKLWGHRVLLKPLLELISSCNNPGNTEVETRLVILLNQLCVSLMQDMELLNMFFSVTPEQDPSRFILFSLLIPFVHREGSIGQQARDALLLCMALSRKSETIASYIGKHSSLCPVLATGLSGLYSALPHRLKLPPADGSTNSWHCLEPEDAERVPELKLFLDSLEFTNAIFQIAHPLVQSELLEYIFHGFLVPVMGPALHQLYAEEVVAATAYLDLFLRTVSEPSLVYVFLKFIFTCKYEGSRIIDTIVSRLTSCPDRAMALVTMSLLRTLIDLNCEDVMLDLVFKYLLPGSHVMVSQRKEISGLDARSASKLLTFVPRCCRVSADDDTANGEKFGVYLREARRNAKSLQLACRCWRFGYEQSTGSGGKSLQPDSTLLDPGIKTKPVITRTGRTGSDGDVWRKRGDASWTQTKSVAGPAPPAVVITSSCGRTTTSTLPAAAVDVHVIFREIENMAKELRLEERDVEEDTEPDFMSFLDSYLLKFEVPQAVYPSEPFDDWRPVTRTSSSSSSGTSEAATPLPPDIGLFLNSVFERLENMLENDFRVNLQLTGLISKLAAFPQPLLRSFLLSDSLVCQPAVRSLPQVLASLRQKFDQATAGIGNVADVVREARRFLRDVAPRTPAILQTGSEEFRPPSASSMNSEASSFAHKVESKYQSFASKLFRRGKKSSPASNQVNGTYDSGFLEELPGEGYRYRTSHYDASLPHETPTSSSRLFGHGSMNANSGVTSLILGENGTSRRDRSATIATSGVEMSTSAASMMNNRKAPRRVVLAAVIFDEWLHELAAMALEHSLVGEEFSFFFPGSPSK